MSSATPKPPKVQVDYMEGKLRGRGFTVVRAVLMVLCRVLFRLKVEGVNNVPRTGGVLVVSNHLHNLDPLLVCVAFPRPLHFMAKQELMGVPIVGHAIRYGGGFPVNRAKPDRQAIVQATDRLQQGIAVGIFPEGTRSKSRKIERVLPGAGLIALRGDALILPVSIVGSERLPFNGSKQLEDRSGFGRRQPVTVTFGKPFRLGPGADGKRLSSEQALNEAMVKVAELLPESYRGIYGSDSL